MALAVALVALARRRELRRTDLALGTVAASGALAGLIGLSTQWAFVNALIPAVFFPVFAATVLCARLAQVAGRGTATTTLAGLAAVLLLCAQVLHAPWPSAADRPTDSDRIAAGHLLAELRTLPGPVFIPSHPFYGVLAGHQPFMHSMGLADIRALLGKQSWIAQAIEQGKFAAIVLDREPTARGWPGLDRHYRLERTLEPGRNTVRMFTGAPSTPRFVYVRR
jgi:hypothetical protein